jgi:hypothetical protein
VTDRLGEHIDDALGIDGVKVRIGLPLTPVSMKKMDNVERGGCGRMEWMRNGRERIAREGKQ